MLGKIYDVGASLDNVPPVVMKAHANHVECALIKILQTQFNMVFSTGIVPGIGNGIGCCCYIRGMGLIQVSWTAIEQSVLVVASLK